MRPEHAPIGDPCLGCGLRADRHRKRSRPGRERGYVPRSVPRAARLARIIGIDGEGKGRRPHRYTFLAAVDELGTSDWSVHDNAGLTTERCLDFILSLPERALIFGYAFQYDLAKMLSDVSSLKLYQLFHEETRRHESPHHGHIVYHPVKWRGFSINYMNRRFTVAKGPKQRTIWDVFTFFACKFTSALEDWKILTPEERRLMAEMKDQRSVFDQLSDDEIHAYCKKECHALAMLMRALIRAHEGINLNLKTYFGSGSTSTAFLEKLGNVKKAKDSAHPIQMNGPIASAFFGGRFENSIIGLIEGKVYNYDISSAYPYQMCFLPCLEHGRWEWAPASRSLESRIGKADLALIHWYLPVVTKGQKAWAPFPVRSADGTIAFPIGARGGWVWRSEFIAARKLFPHVEIQEGAWLYHTDCVCQPFKDVPRYYNERLKLGKDHAGIVLKRGLNGGYGKFAQSKGHNPPFQSWIWAGNITAGTRAQLLEAIGLADDPWNVLMLATDGVWTRTPLKLPKPVETGTGASGKPLGGWEEKVFDKGVMAVRPGIYFPIDPSPDEIEKVRARGLGRAVLYQQWQKLVDGWRKREPKVVIKVLDRFCGIKTSLHKGKESIRRSENFGEWVPHRIEVSFSPLPKREAVLPDGRLKLWGFFPAESIPYDAAVMSGEAKAIKDFTIMAEEQPDADFSEIDNASE